jgi:DNA polymerase-3 subunit beta
MNIVLLKNNLKEALSIISGIRKENAQLPILKNFLLETKDGKLCISSTDLEMGVTHALSAKVIEEGSVTVPYAIFSQIISNLSFERVTLELKGGSLAITTDNYNAKIGTTPRDDFPIIPSLEHAANSFAVEADVLVQSLGAVMGACQVSDFRPELSGVLFHYKGGALNVVATDSFRLAKRSISDKKVEAKAEGDVSFIVPLKTIQEVVRIFGGAKEGKISISSDETQIVFETDSTRLISRLIEGKFPDYEMVIPRSFETEVSLDKDDLASALKLTSSLANRLNEVRIMTDETMKNIRIISSSHEFGESEYLLPAKIKGQGVQISFNWRFILDGLRTIKTQTVFLGLNGEHRPSLLQAPDDDSFTYILTSIKAA